jgi:hypothetical protein
MAAKILLCCTTIAILVIGCAAKGSFLELVNSNASVHDAEERLLSELANVAKQRVGSSRVANMQTSLQPLFQAMPKEKDGRISHTVVMYMLHRFFAMQRGWTIRGLEPNAAPQNSSAFEMQGWMPEYLQGFLESIVGTTTLSLREVSVLAATLEDFIQKEERQWLDKVYELLWYEKADYVSKADLSKVLEVFLMIYNLDGNLTSPTPQVFDTMLNDFAGTMKVWNKTQAFIRHVVDDAFARGQEGLKYEEVLTRVREVGEHYSSVYDNDCKDMKDELVRLESKKPGRVRLADFYKASLNGGVWEFTEKRDYLRTFGALDESDPSTPLVIIPNYVGGRQNCLTASTYYALCCRNECEDLMQSLEKKIAAPAAQPTHIVALIESMASSSVSAPRTLPVALIERLERVAALNGGHVPLHGRLFAQWMHHAFPRECAYPHEAGTTSALTPDEWMKETGQENSKATMDEMLEQVRTDSCRLTPTGVACGQHRGLLSKAARPSATEEAEENIDLPWNEKEELLVLRPSLVDQAKSSNRNYLKDLLMFAILASMVSALSWSLRSFLKFLPLPSSRKPVRCTI